MDGAPRKVNDHVFEDKLARFARAVGRHQEGGSVFGHTHKPWIQVYRCIQFINCGSVRMAHEGNPRAASAILELDQTGRVTASIERLPHDAKADSREVAAAGLPSEYAAKLVAAA